MGLSRSQKYSNLFYVTSPGTITDVPDLSGLVRLTHHRWVIPLVAAIGRGNRFVAIQHALGVPRQTLHRALEAAEALDLVLRNPGYGHPLRPEFVLAPDGERIQPACVDVAAQVRSMRAGELMSRKWSLPVLAALHAANGPLRFRDLAILLPTVSPGALTRSLDDLMAERWVSRPTDTERPSRWPYVLGTTAVEIAERAMALARRTVFP